MIAPLLLTAFLAQSGATADPQAAKVSGKVISATTGDPLKKVIVTLDGGKNRFQAVTNADGKFVFDKVPPDDYTLQPDRMGYLEGRQTEVEVGAGEEKTDLTLKLTPQSILSGRVVDEDGDSLVGGGVWGYRVFVAGQNRRVLATAEADVNAEGGL